MGIPRFFKIPQHKQFHYEPIYYDERKERLEERIRQIEAEHGIKNGDQPVRTLRKGSFSHYYERKRKTQKYSSTRLIIIIIFLLFISYYLFIA
jgi:3-phenylpropionate/cinnamic acid dioxygenase small subunit